MVVTGKGAKMKANPLILQDVERGLNLQGGLSLGPLIGRAWEDRSQFWRQSQVGAVLNENAPKETWEQTRQTRERGQRTEDRLEDCLKKGDRRRRATFVNGLLGEGLLMKHGPQLCKSSERAAGLQREEARGQKETGRSNLLGYSVDETCLAGQQVEV